MEIVNNGSIVSTCEECSSKTEKFIVLGGSFCICESCVNEAYKIMDGGKRAAAERSLANCRGRGL